MMTTRWRIPILCLLLSLLALGPLGANGVDQILLSTGNDALSLGLGNNQDDGRSFSLRTAVIGGRGWNTAVELTSHTDQRVSGHRYDTLDFTFAYPHHIAIAPAWSLVITPGLGLKLIGSFGLEEAQTLLHSFKAKKPVILPVSSEELAIHPGGSLKVELSYHHRKSRYSLIIATDHRHSWESEVEASLRFLYGDTVSLSAGYHFTKGWSGFPSQYMQEERYNGLYLASDFDANLLFTSYRYYPHSGFTYGYIGIDPLALTKEKTFKNRDLTTVQGLYYEVDLNPLRLTSIGIRPFFLDVFYISGPVIDGYRYNIGDYGVSYQFEFFSDNAFLRPTLQLGAGIKRFNLVKDFDVVQLEEVRASMTVGAGIGLGPRYSWIIANSAYSLKLGAYLTHIFGTESLQAPIAAYGRHTKAWVFLMGISLVVDHDFNGG